MNTDLSQLDAAWAWQPYQPDADRPWNIARAAHLHRRAAFAANWSQLQETLKLGPTKSIEKLFATPQEVAAGPRDLAAFDQQMLDLGGAMIATGNPRQLSAWWLYRMAAAPHPLTEKMTLFWHNHFATSAAKVTEPQLMLDQNALLRRHALGSFEAMVRAISRDPAMLIWLDSTTNRKIHPNENYARELMELFCLGPGHYTEKDIKEIARAFSGWEVRRNKFVFNAHQHDTGSKSFLGNTGDFGGEEAIRIVLEQPAAARFIVGKLTRFFVCDEPELPPTLIEPLAQQLRDNQFQIAPVVRVILSSNLFFSDHALGRKVRSPVELGIGLLRAMEATTDMEKLAASLDNLGQAVFFPPNVKGWDGGRTWINSALLLGRANLAHRLMVQGQARFPHGGIAKQAQRDGASTPAAAVDYLLQLLVAVPVPDDARRSLVELAQAGSTDENNRLARTVAAIAALPEFQLS